MRVRKLNLVISEPELTRLEQIRAAGFSNLQEIIRCATLAWIRAAEAHETTHHTPHPQEPPRAPEDELNRGRLNPDPDSTGNMP